MEDPRFATELTPRTDHGYTSPGLLTQYDESSEYESDEEEADPVPEMLESLRKCRKAFQEYEAQRTEPTLYHCLHTAYSQTQDGLGAEHESPPGDLRRFQKACIGFEEALLKLPNLHGFLANFPPGFFWHGYHFNEGYEFSGREVSEQVAPLAFALRTLGKRNAVSSSLASMKLYLCESSLWGLEALDQAWIPRDNRRLEIAGPLMNAQSRTLMDDAFIHLTNLVVASADNEDLLESLKALARLLNTTKELVRLEILVFEFHPESLLDLDMLNQFNGVQWPMLQELRLQHFVFTPDSLLHLLSLLAPTLKSLQLQGCVLLGQQSTWADFYPGMRLLPFQQLRHLEFRDCHQQGKDVRGAPYQHWSSTDVKDNPLVMHHMMGGLSSGFSSKIYDYILKETDIMPPLKLYMNDDILFGESSEEE